MKSEENESKIKGRRDKIMRKLKEIYNSDEVFVYNINCD